MTKALRSIKQLIKAWLGVVLVIFSVAVVLTLLVIIEAAICCWVLGGFDVHPGLALMSCIVAASWTILLSWLYWAGYRR